MRSLVLALLVVASTPAAGTGQHRSLGPDVQMHSAFASKFLAKPRDIIVWLPPGYEKERDRRYPVLYMHDGANVYVEWRIDEIVKPLIASGEVEPLIIVLVPNGGQQQDRFEDYTWTKPPRAKFGGKAEAYGRMLVEELKPFIDREYRTLPDAANTGMGGASLGALVSLHFALAHPDVFGKLMLMSPAVWWDDRLLLRDVGKLKARPSIRIWLDVGQAESPSMIRDAQALRDTLARKGWKRDADLTYFELPDGRHDEAWFARRAGPALKYLFPGGSVKRFGAAAW